MDWLHCNFCFHQPGQLPKRNFMLTSCGHVFCHCCEQPGSIEKCKMCGVKCTTVALAAEMPPSVTTYFEEPGVLLEKAVSVINFQKSHAQRLNENYRRVLEKYRNLKVHCQRLDEEYRNLKRQLQMYKSRQNIDVLTPPSHPSPQLPLFCKNSQASKEIMMGASQPSPSPAFFATPSRTPVYSRQQYRNQNMTPITPNSDASCSPASQASRHSYRSDTNAGRTNRPQHSYMPGLTPTFDGMSMLSVQTPPVRDSSRK